MPEIIVRARTDGRGGVKPFGTFSKHQAGAMVQMGNREYKVTKDGRVNIPKKIMDKYGVSGKDGRKRIAINFSTKPSTKKAPHWKSVAAVIAKPDIKSKDLKTNNAPVYTRYIKPEFDISEELIPETEGDFTWS